MVVRLLGIVVLIGLLVVVFVNVYHRWISYWITSDKIDFLVASGTLALAVATVLLARFTLQSVRASRDIIEAEDRRHRQSVAPIIKATPIIDAVRREITGLELTNLGLGPALKLGVTADVQYERREYHEFQSFAVMETQTVPMINVLASAVAPNGRATVSNGARQGWVLSSEGFGCGKVTITYRDLFGNLYTSIGGHLFNDYYEWFPPPRLFPGNATDAALKG